jgi:calpain, invertebrate
MFTSKLSACFIVCVSRLNGSYEALSGGLISESLTDLTGGLVVRFELGRNAPDNLLQIMLKAQSKGSLMGCSIDVRWIAPIKF